MLSDQDRAALEAAVEKLKGFPAVALSPTNAIERAAASRRLILEVLDRNSKTKSKAPSQ